MDTVSTMLVYSVFFKDSKTLIYEDTENILTSAYASRSSKTSLIVSLFDTRINTKNLTLFNLHRRNKYPINYIDIVNFTNQTSFYYNLFSKSYFNMFDK
jgi:hypothetical protein